MYYKFTNFTRGGIPNTPAESCSRKRNPRPPRQATRSVFLDPTPSATPSSMTDKIDISSQNFDKLFHRKYFAYASAIAPVTIQIHFGSPCCIQLTLNQRTTTGAKKHAPLPGCLTGISHPPIFCVCSTPAPSPPAAHPIPRPSARHVDLTLLLL